MNGPFPCPTCPQVFDQPGTVIHGQPGGLWALLKHINQGCPGGTQNEQERVMSIEEQIRAELDETLAEQIRAEQIEREKRFEHNNASKAVSEFDDRARKLRLALYRLSGEQGEAGDANVDNHRRKSEIARGEVGSDVS